jgi:hypothetical protein
MGDHMFVVLRIKLLRMLGSVVALHEVCWCQVWARRRGRVRCFRGMLVDFALLFPPAATARLRGAQKHGRGRCYGPSKLIATAVRSICSFEWLLFRQFVSAVVQKGYAGLKW